MKKRYRITPPSNNYKIGSTLRTIGAGAYGLGEGVLDTVTSVIPGVGGIVDKATDKGYEALQGLGGNSTGKEDGARGIGQTLGAVGGAIINPTAIPGAIGTGVEGVSQTLGATGNEALGTAGEGLTQVTNMAMPFIGAPGESMGSGTASGIEMGTGLSFRNGGVTDPPPKKKTIDDLEREAAIRRQRIADMTYGEFHTPEKSMFKSKKVYPGDPIYDRIWNPSTRFDPDTDEKWVMDNYKPDYILTTESGDPSLGYYPYFSKRFTVPTPKPITFEGEPSLPIKEINALNPGEIKKTSLPRANLYTERNPYTGEFEVMSPSQGRMLSREAYKLQNKGMQPSLDNMPQFKGELINAISMKPSTIDERINYQTQNPEKYPEFATSMEKIVQNYPFTKKLNSTNTETMANKKYGGNMFRYGGNIYSNGGFGDNNMNEIPVTQFGNGGTHEENPLGGIPQGVGANGKQNLVEQGELKVPDPRPQSEGGFFIISADPTMKLTKAIAEQYDIPKKYVGKSVLKAAESILRKDSRREGDSIEQNSINIELANFLDAHEELTAMKEAKEEGKFMEELAALEEKYPEYMQALMGAQEQPMEQPMDPSMGGMGQGMEQQMSPEEQAMMEQQMMAQQQGGMPQGGMPQGAPGMEQGMDPAMMGMPPEAMGMAYGGKMYEYGGNMYGPGGNMIKRADGSYSQRGLWDNIRANKGSGKEPTSQMLEQERRIKGNSKMYGGNLYETGGSFNNPGFEALPENVQDKIKSNSMNYGGNMYEYGSTMGNMYGMGANMYNLGDFMSVDNLDLNSQTQLTGGVGNDIIGLSEEEKKFDPANQFSYQKSLGTLAGQAAPIVGNLISGLLPPKEYDGSLGRISPVELERQQLGQRGVQIDQSFAQAQNAMQAAGGSGYMSNIGRLQNIRDTNTQAALTDIANKNTEIDALEQKLNLEVEKGNISQADKEFQLNEAAEAAKAAALREAAKQTAQIATAGEQNKLAMMYNKMYAPNYNFDYQGNPFAGMFKKDQQTS